MIRTRFAPSPTGFLHVGGIRTALFAYLVARQSGGQFILRLEDTDKNREVEGSAQHIIDCLTALGLNYDEGPDIGGPYAPYKQSERLDSYKAWAEKLIKEGRAYVDPYTPAEVQAFREQAQAEKKPFLYRNHRPDIFEGEQGASEVPADWFGKHPLRFKSDPKAYQWHDEVMGDLSTGPEVIDDFILIKSDGYPTYNFAHIVDDAEMKVTHVIRGQEFISSTPNYLNLYDALGFDMSIASHSTSSAAEGKSVMQGAEATETPTADERGRRGEAEYKLPIFATMPHIMNEQGNKKLGKRDGAKDVLEYIKEGFLPETMLSFIATLGWNDGTEQEVFTKDELIQEFSLNRVQKSGARFDEKRLLWMNGQFIRELSINELSERVKDFWPDSAKEAAADYRQAVLTLTQDRLKTLADLPQLTSYFFSEPTPDWNLIEDNKQLKKLSADEIQSLLRTSLAALEASEWSSDAIQNTLNSLLETTGQKPGILFSLIRIVTTWAPFSPQLNDTLALLGKETTLIRISNALR